jgi:peptidoglycan/LPS O-acetylase OafA/YrhL
MKYRREIDGLRAVAVLPVIFFHAGFSQFGGGFVGVDVFFVISGYLITTVIYTELQKGSFSLVRFWERRARRILPALFLVMLTSLLFAWQWLLPQQMKSFAQSLVASSTFSSNILFWRQSDYFDPGAELKPLLHTWSLAIEEQYYLFFPIFMLIAYRIGKRWLVRGLLVATLLGLFLAEIISSRSPSAAYYLLPTRGWELLIGGLTAFIHARWTRHDRPRLVNEVGAWIGLCMIGYAVVAFDKFTPFPSLYALVPVIGASLFILSGESETLAGRVLSTKPLVGIGLVSYSAYLWHQPIFALARERSLVELSDAIFWGCIALTLGLAYLSWKYVETPFRNKGFLTRKGVFAFSVAGSGVFVVIGAIGHLSNGFPGRFDEATMAYVAGVQPGRNPQYDCNTGGLNFRNPDQSCVLGNKDAVVGALIGDSHADAIAHALADELDRRGLGMLQMTYGGCPPSPGLFRSGEFRCAEYNAKVAGVLADPKLSTVIVLARWSIYAEGQAFDNGEGGSNMVSAIYGLTSG